MFDRFTDRARKVMGLARQEAQRFNHDYIGTEHILLGLVHEGSGVAASVLKSLHVDLPRVQAAVESLISKGTANLAIVTQQLPFTPRAKTVLELSLEEAQLLGHTYIGTEHLLLGLIDEVDGVAAQALVKMGVSAEAVRREIMSLLGAGDEPDDTFPYSESELATIKSSNQKQDKRWLATVDHLEKAYHQAIHRLIKAESALNQAYEAIDALHKLPRYR
jgi:ATP-dependent Clp protease ATP-binding subunit ClpC